MKTKHIYNKNAREAHLMAEAYSQVNEGRGHAGPVPGWKKQAGLEKAFKDFDDEQRDQDPHRHEGLSDFDAEQRDQDPHRHEDAEDQVFGLVDASGNIVSLYDNEGIMRQVMEGRPDLKAITFDELPFNVDVT